MDDAGIAGDMAQAAAGGFSLGGGLYTARWLLLWITGRADKKQATIEAQEAKVDLEWQAIREDLKRERKEDRERVDQVERQNKALRFAFHHVAGALIRLDPQNPALAQAEQMLAAAFPLDIQLLAERASAAIDSVHGR